MVIFGHRYGDYFPGTGHVEDVGHGVGKNYSINFPLWDGVDDDMFVSIFKSIMSKVMEKFRPNAVVLQFVFSLVCLCEYLTVCLFSKQMRR